MTISNLDELDDDVPADDDPATVILVPRSLASDVRAYANRLERRQRAGSENNPHGEGDDGR